MPTDYFDEVADMLARSLSVGTYYSREYLIAMLRKKYKTEDELRELVARGTVQAQRMADETLAKAKAMGGEIVGMAVPLSITCPKCRMTSHNLQDVAQGWCGNCNAYTTARPNGPTDVERH